jgi:hypothetical protein
MQVIDGAFVVIEGDRQHGGGRLKPLYPSFT